MRRRRCARQQTKPTGGADGGGTVEYSQYGGRYEETLIRRNTRVGKARDKRQSVVNESVYTSSGSVRIRSVSASKDMASIVEARE